MIHVPIILIIILLRVFTCYVMHKVFEPIKRGLLEIVRGEADFVAVHKDTCQFDPIRLGELHRCLSLIVIFDILLGIVTLVLTRRLSFCYSWAGVIM